MSIGELFHKPPGIYLLSHSVGLAPKQAKRWIDHQYLDVWANDPALAWPSWLDEIEAFRATLARLFNHDPAGFCPQSNVSSATTKILHSLPAPGARPTIVLTEEAFPSLGFVAKKAARFGYNVRFIRATEDTQDPAVWEHHLTGDVGVVIITHVHSNTGRLIPVEPIAELARQRQIVSIVDVTQSAGVVPIDLATWDPDFIVGSCVKWLCGGPGAGYLWANPAIVERCQPIDVGWFSHEDPFEFDINQFRYAADSMRFFGATPSVAPFVIARQSIELLINVGISSIRDHNLTLGTALIESLPPVTVVSPHDPELRSGTVVIAPRRDGIVEQLAEAKIHLDQRSTGIRISPHIYNTTAEMDVAAEFIMSRSKATNLDV